MPVQQGGAAEPGVLRPMSVGLLDRLQKDHPRMASVRWPDRQQASRGFDEIAGQPGDTRRALRDLIADFQSPGGREAGDGAGE